jgi:hypothetical protein
LDWVVELPRRAAILARGSSERVPAIELLGAASWKEQGFVSPATGQRISYAVADLGCVFLPGGDTSRLFAAQTGAIQGVHQGTIIGLSSVKTAAPAQLLRALGWVRWIRALVHLPLTLAAA